MEIGNLGHLSGLLSGSPYTVQCTVYAALCGRSGGCIGPSGSGEASSDNFAGSTPSRKAQYAHSTFRDIPRKTNTKRAAVPATTHERAATAPVRTARGSCMMPCCVRGSRAARAAMHAAAVPWRAQALPLSWTRWPSHRRQDGPRARCARPHAPLHPRGAFPRAVHVPTTVAGLCDVWPQQRSLSSNRCARRHAAA